MGKSTNALNSREREYYFLVDGWRAAPTILVFAFLVLTLTTPLTPPVTMALCREAEGRRKLFERSEFFRRLHDGSGTGVSAEGGAAFFWLLFLAAQEK